MTTERTGPGANNQPVKILSIGGSQVEVDAEIAQLVTALNVGGFPTKASCSGHGNRPATIGLADGRWIVVAKDRAEWKRIEALFPTDINGNTRSLTPQAGEGVERVRFVPVECSLTNRKTGEHRAWLGDKPLGDVSSAMRGHIESLETALAAIPPAGRVEEMRELLIAACAFVPQGLLERISATLEGGQP